MSQHKKLFSKAERNPSGLDFSELHTLMIQCGWVKDRQRGSHQIWYSPKGMRLSIQMRNGMAKGIRFNNF